MRRKGLHRELGAVAPQDLVVVVEGGEVGSAMAAPFQGVERKYDGRNGPNLPFMGVNS